MAKRGAPSKYKPEYCQQLLDYFNSYFDALHKSTNGKTIWTLPFFERFANKIEVNVDTLHEWKKKHPEFSEAYKKAKHIQKEYLITLGINKLIDTTAFIFTAKNITDMRDKTETDITSGGKPLLNGKSNSNNNSNKKTSEAK